MNRLIRRLVEYFSNLSLTSKVALTALLFLGIIGIFVQVLFPDKPPTVSGISPSYEFGIPENSNFSISFTQVLNDTTKDNLSFKVEPPISAKTFWLDNNYQYYIELEENLQTNTQYLVTVLYKNKSIFSHEYLTSAFTTEEQAQHIREQAQEDIKFNEALENMRKEFPWYNDIPIDNSQYTIVYDFDRKEFRIRLKVPENTDTEIVSNLTKKALSSMEAVNINPKEWGYYVLFLK